MDQHVRKLKAEEPIYDSIQETGSAKTLGEAKEHAQQLSTAKGKNVQLQGSVEQSVDNRTTLKPENGVYDIDKARQTYKGAWHEGTDLYKVLINCPDHASEGMLNYIMRMDIPDALPDKASVKGHARVLNKDGSIDDNRMTFNGTIKKDDAAGDMTYTGTLVDNISPSCRIIIPNLKLSVTTPIDSLPPIESINDVDRNGPSIFIPGGKTNNEYAFLHWLHPLRKPEPALAPERPMY